VVNHLRSLLDMNDPVDGPRVRAKRQAQAEFLAAELQALQAAGENVVSVGDYNAFQFNDGYVDGMGTIKGNPAPADQVVVNRFIDLVNPDFINLIDTGLIAPAQRYSYTFDGNAQAIDHILVNTTMNARASRFAFARVDADFPEIYRTDATRPEKISDHDAPVAYFTLPLEVTSKVNIFRSGYVFNRVQGTSNGSITITNNSGGPLSGPIHVVLQGLNVTLANPAGQSANGPYVSAPGGLAPGASATLPVIFNNPTRGAITYTARVFSGSL
jgi:hypothetical protein